MTRKLYIEVDDQGKIEVRADWVPETLIEVMGVLKLGADAIYSDWQAGMQVSGIYSLDIEETCASTIRVHPRETSA